MFVRNSLDPEIDLTEIPGVGVLPIMVYTGRPRKGYLKFFRLQVYKRVVISQLEVYKRVGKSVISVFKRTFNHHPSTVCRCLCRGRQFA